MQKESAVTVLRSLLQMNGLYAYLQKKGDGHLSQYLAREDQRIKRVTGFKGSNALFFVSMNEATVFTDPRYLGFQINPQFSLQIVKSDIDWKSRLSKDVKQEEPNKPKLGFCQSLFSKRFVDTLKDQFDMVNTEILLSKVDDDLPKDQQHKVFQFETEFTTANKLHWLKTQLKKLGAQALAVDDLTEIAWLLGLRSRQYIYTPMFKAFSLLSADQSNPSYIFTNKQLSKSAVKHLNDNKVTIMPYHDFFPKIREENKNKRKIAHSENCTLALREAVEEEVCWNGIELQKALKKKDQVAGFRDSCIKDGCALVKAFRWLEEQITSGKQITECDFVDKVDGERAKQPDFFSLSFDSIMSCGANGAIIHYKPERGTDAKLIPNEMLLLDSGGQYMNGTTDITRCAVIGTPSAKHKQIYTRVLVGNLRLERVTWQKDYQMKGKELDVYARSKLKEVELDFQHGTGHGVGYFLNVHEGPQGINVRSEVNFQEGMVTSNEPGCYLKGEFGVRVENMIVVVPKGEDKLGFDNLSAFPYALNLLDLDLMEEQDIKHINSYHKWVRQEVGKRLSGSDLEWLVKATEPIKV